MAVQGQPISCRPKLAPLVKWAGGKRQLLHHLLNHAPQFWNKYFEPFVGGGALLTELYLYGRINQALISDTNLSLYNLYVVVKEKPNKLIKALEKLTYGNKSEDYYDARNFFNSKLNEPIPNPTTAALFLYLNRHCYNGLWRVNSQGEYNVPFGKYTKPSLPSRDAINSFSMLLQKIEVCNLDFELAVSNATAGDFIYFDPPYQPVSGTAYFTDYTAFGFSEVDQERLARVSFELDQRGVQVMVSNSDTPLIRKLYSGFNIYPVTTRRAINSHPGKRDGAAEVIITNY